jgi:hypothetical protein
MPQGEKDFPYERDKMVPQPCSMREKGTKFLHGIISIREKVFKQKMTRLPQGTSSQTFDQKNRWEKLSPNQTSLYHWKPLKT